MVDIAGSLVAAKGLMWVVFAMFLLLMFSKELRPLVDMLIQTLVKAVKSI